ncbi:hypothetical protein LZ554_005784 [Drepanopeziza brunnea f. sp. 'monogermtubi']|nr:hypothetical protein LZ554_005784 [Drepanopeziza brunnea f. sp. 'monogermtubi']
MEEKRNVALSKSFKGTLTQQRKPLCCEDTQLPTEKSSATLRKEGTLKTTLFKASLLPILLFFSWPMVKRPIMALKFIVGLIAASQLVRGNPSPSGLGSDLSILINNDLSGAQSPTADSGVILLTPRSQVSAASACEALGEQLWSPELSISGIQGNLEYLAYQEKYSDDQLYWIASNGSEARAVTGNGQLAVASPDSLLPALCTQSAPFSDISSQDTSSRWQVTVHANNEYITGFRDSLSFRFLGVRFAPQPERFTYSKAYEGSGNNASALNYGSQCVQAGGGSEDCLFLNIWTPFLPADAKAAKKDLKPVIFFMHGGTFTSGTCNDPTFDGGNLASRGDVVVVAINYRLATFGYLALDDGVTKGNYGLADQINALDWVRSHIHNFGGDPDRITLLGQSAGGISVRALLASPKSVGKVKAAIVQSNVGGGGFAEPYSSWLDIPSQMRIASNAVLAEKNCAEAVSRVDCLRKVPATSLISGTQAGYLSVDGTYLKTSQLVVNKSASKSLQEVHLMAGLTRDDGAALITYVETTNLSQSLTENGLSSTFANSPLFPLSAKTSLGVYNVTSRLATDTFFRCFKQASSYASVQNSVFAPDQYFFEFNRTYQIAWSPNGGVCDAPKSPTHPFGDPDAEYFKCHSGDLLYVFGTLAYNQLPMRDENDLPFMQFVVDAWTSFARTYNPNPDKGFLEARGYTNTSRQLEMAGEWMPVSKDGGLEMRSLQWPSSQAGFRDLEQCAELGWPLDYQS